MASWCFRPVASIECQKYKDSYTELSSFDKHRCVKSTKLILGMNELQDKVNMFVAETHRTA